jgi:hypothetical protein
VTDYHIIHSWWQITDLWDVHAVTVIAAVCFVFCQTGSSRGGTQT